MDPTNYRYSSPRSLIILFLGSALTSTVLNNSNRSEHSFVSAFVPTTQRLQSSNSFGQKILSQQFLGDSRQKVTELFSNSILASENGSDPVDDDEDEAMEYDISFEDIEVARKQLEHLLVSSNNYYPISSTITASDRGTILEKTSGQKNLHYNMRNKNSYLRIRASNISAIIPAIDDDVISLIVKSDGDNERSDDVDMTRHNESVSIQVNAPLMTTIQRLRRQAEIRQLEQLRYGDSAIADIWELWNNERGTQAAQQLKYIRERSESTDPSIIREIETMLIDMINVHGIYFAEPINQLAVLYYRNGYVQDANLLWKLVVLVKPWHFGAISGLVKSFEDSQQSLDAIRWASKRLPSFTSIGKHSDDGNPSMMNKRRNLWVNSSLRLAQNQLDEAEKLLHKSFLSTETGSNIPLLTLTEQIKMNMGKGSIMQNDLYRNHWQ